MDDWDTIFRAAQRIVQGSPSILQGLHNVVTIARSHPELCDDAAFWGQVSQHPFTPAFAMMVDWARQGLAALEPATGSEFLLLDLEDCPEIFRLYQPGGQHLIPEQRLRASLTQSHLIGTDDLTRLLPSELSRAEAFQRLFGEARRELSVHHVRELHDPILDWTGDDEFDFHESSGYFLWLVLGSLALLEPLRDVGLCKTVLQGRDQLFLLVGFEGLFCYTGALTPEGFHSGRIPG